MLDYTKTWLAVRGITLFQDKRGVTALEYGLIAALMAAVIIFAFGVLGNGLKTTMNTINTTLSSSE
ncbi:MAG: Flp family type IVb pilin [Acidiphilium sp.]|nr:Flp family type IVb pilin [Acidiphilium sp.]MDD4936300.1 Flp family type IVb pilin [Acidiphilium sp.]